MLKKTSWLLLSIALLVSSVSLVNVAKAVDPSIFVTPATTIGDLTPAPGSIITLKVNVSDIPAPGLWGHEFYMNLSTAVFPPVIPLTNMNFTSAATGWTTTSQSGTGTPTSGFDGADGNPSPGSGPGSYYVRASSDAIAAASITFLVEQQFTWNLGTPVDALLSYAWKVSGVNIVSGSTFGIRVTKPDATFKTLITAISFSAARPWTYTMTTTSATAFDQVGTYKFEMRILAKAAIGAGNYAQVNFDDVGLNIAPVGVTEGPFLPAGGTTYFTAKYFRSDGGYLYVADSLTGTPYVNAFPQIGSGNIAVVKLLVGYGAAWLDLRNTLLLTIGDPPSYPPTPLTHTAIDGYFKNKIPGDANGDGVVDIFDILKVKFHWYPGPPLGAGGYDRSVDTNDDGAIDIFDILKVKADWGRHYP